MGEVYRARDTKLGRDVALKILPREFAADRERVARFRREAHLLAALNHPHIATIHGLEDTAGELALVMELVEGATLAERLSAAADALDTDEALRIARQIALALEAAHESGIIHRDLKPANIKVRDDGVVKVLDFGLAKDVVAGASDTANSPTVTSSALTGMGALLGTAAYMSPEQARGKPVDKRADIWAFGVILYEMLARRRLFAGESATDVIAQVLTAEPDMAALPAAVPAAIRTLLKRCLTRDRANRLRDIGDARIAIDEGLAPPKPDAAPGIAPAERPRWAQPWPIATAGLVGAALGVIATLGLRPAPIDGPAGVPTRTSITLPASQHLSAAISTTLGLSPDGRRLVYKARAIAGGRIQLFLREMRLGGESRPLAGTETAESFALSPDGESIAFGTAGATAVMRMPLSGGAPTKICGCAARSGMYWSPDGFIYFSTWEGTKLALRRVAAFGGNPVSVTVSPAFAEKQLSHPAPLPGGRLLVAVSDPHRSGYVLEPTLASYEIDTGIVKPLEIRGTSPWYLPTGHLLFVRDSTLLALPFDPDTLTAHGEPVPLVEHITVSSTLAQADYAVANDAGTIVYGAPAFSLTRVVKVQGDGAPQPVLAPQGYQDLDLSTDGRHLAVTVDPRGIADHFDWGIPYQGVIYTSDLVLGDMTRRAAGNVRRPVFFPNSTRIAYSTGSAGKWTVQFGDATFESILTLTDRTPPRMSSFSRDGTRLAYELNGNLHVVALDGDRTPKSYLSSRYQQLSPAFSPDGRWIAHDLNDGRGGQRDVWVRPYPGPEPGVRISTEGGREPRWSADGRRLFFLSADRLMAVDVVPGATFRASPPRPVASQLEGVHAFAVAPDGTFFAIVGDVPGPTPAHAITVVTNWFDEVRQVQAR